MFYAAVIISCFCIRQAKAFTREEMVPLLNSGPMPGTPESCLLTLTCHIWAEKGKKLMKASWDTDGQKNVPQAHTEHGNGQRWALCTKQEDFTARWEVCLLSIYFVYPLNRKKRQAKFNWEEIKVQIKEMMILSLTSEEQGVHHYLSFLLQSLNPFLTSGFLSWCLFLWGFGFFWLVGCFFEVFFLGGCLFFVFFN